MRKIILIAIGTVLCGLLVVLGSRSVTKQPLQPNEFLQPDIPAASSGRETPADKQVIAAQTIIKRNPNAPEGYNGLAIAYMQKARESGDFSFNAKAETALKRSLEIAPDNYEAIKLQARLSLVYHRFAEALETANRALGQRPRDFEVYGFVTDALVELGRYKEAVEAADKMMMLRPYTASYARVSYLRALHGHTEGAIETMRMAATSANPGDPEGMAWCYVHLGDELMNAGKRVEAEREYDRALYIFPNYHLALTAKARARVAAGDAESAVNFYKQALERVPTPEAAMELGDLLTKLNQPEEAKKQYDLVEFIERNGAHKGTYSRTLALFWAEHDMKLDEALEIAKRERAARADIYTSDTLAWCLYKKGQLVEAKTAIDEAMRLGTRDARILYHAGMIYKALGDRQNATKHLKSALAINPSFDVLQADVAKQTLRDLTA